MGCRIALVAALALTCSACWTRTPQEIQRDYAKESLAPAAIQPTHAEERAAKPDVDPSTARPLPVRLYVDETYRRGMANWQDRIAAQVLAVSQLLTQQFGVRLQVVTIATWDRESGDSPTLENELAALQALDPGEDVEWVIGFVAARPFTNDWHQMGLARLPGKHVVVRNMARLVERQQHEKVLDALSAQEREKLYVNRRKHKEVLVLLHELAHTLAVPHDPDGDHIMSPQYDPKIAEFSSASEQLLRLGLEWHARTDAGAQQKWQRAVADVLAQNPRGFEVSSCEQVQLWTAGQRAVPKAVPRLPPADVTALNHAIELAAKGDSAGAKVAIDAVLARQPGHPKVLDVSCRIESGLRKAGPVTLDRCSHACEAGSEATPCLLAAQALGVVADTPALTRLLDAADARLNGHHAQFPGDAAWLADMRLRRDEPGRALAIADALGFGPEALDLRARLAQYLHSVGLPPHAVPDDRLDAYVQKFRAAQAGVARGERAALDALVAAFADLPGTVILQCQLAARRKPDAAGRALCARAKQAVALLGP